MNIFKTLINVILNLIIGFKSKLSGSIFFFETYLFVCVVELDLGVCNFVHPCKSHSF